MSFAVVIGVSLLLVLILAIYKARRRSRVCSLQWPSQMSTVSLSFVMNTCAMVAGQLGIHLCAGFPIHFTIDFVAERGEEKLFVLCRASGFSVSETFVAEQRRNATLWRPLAPGLLIVTADPISALEEARADTSGP